MLGTKKLVTSEKRGRFQKGTLILLMVIASLPQAEYNTRHAVALVLAQYPCFAKILYLDTVQCLEVYRYRFWHVPISDIGATKRSQ